MLSDTCMLPMMMDSLFDECYLIHLSNSVYMMSEKGHGYYTVADTIPIYIGACAHAPLMCVCMVEVGILHLSFVSVLCFIWLDFPAP